MRTVFSIVLNSFTHDSRVLKESRSLAAAGYRVIVLALHEKNLAEKETISGILVCRIKLVTKQWGKHKLIQTIKYLEFLIRAVIKCRKADLLHCNDLEALPVGVIVARFFNPQSKIVYDSHEYQIERKHFAKLEKILVKTLEGRFIKYADSVITVSNAIADEYAKRYHIPKPALILNCPKYQIVETNVDIRKRIGIPDESIVFLYHGGFSSGRGIENLLEAFATIDDINKAIVLMGYGYLQSNIVDYARHHRNIYYHPAVSPQDVLAYSAYAHMGLLFYEDISLNHRYCLPNKLFDYFMAGLPVLASAALTEVKGLVAKYHVGMSIANTPADIAASVATLDKHKISKLKSRLNELNAQYNWENQETVLLDIYEKLSYS